MFQRKVYQVGFRAWRIPQGPAECVGGMWRTWRATVRTNRFSWTVAVEVDDTVRLWGKSCELRQTAAKFPQAAQAVQLCATHTRIGNDCHKEQLTHECEQETITSLDFLSSTSASSVCTALHLFRRESAVHLAVVETEVTVFHLSGLTIADCIESNVDSVRGPRSGISVWLSNASNVDSKTHIVTTISSSRVA